MVLQNTRLFTVMQLAELISNGIYHSVLKSIGGRKKLVKLKIETTSCLSICSLTSTF